MEFTEEEPGKVWRSGQYKIVKAERFRRSAIVPDNYKAAGPDIYHCYDNGIYVYQSGKLEEAQRRLNKLSKS